MKRLALVALLTATSFAFARSAAAAPDGSRAPAPTSPGRPAARGGEDTFGHARQFHLRVDVSTGYHMLFRYDTSPRCNRFDPTKSEQQKFCGLGAAPAMGLALGYALSDAFEPFAFVRLGLANEAERTNQGNLVQAGIGARLYTMADSRFKLFFAPWIGVDLTGGPADTSTTAGSPGAEDRLAGVNRDAFRTDLLAHLDVGPQFDISKHVAVYLAGGLTFQMLRYLGATAELALGVQLRAP